MRRARPLSPGAWGALLGAVAAAWAAVGLREAADLRQALSQRAPIRQPPEGLWAAIKQAVSDGLSHDVTRRAATLAYYSVLSMAPLVLIMIAIVGLAFGDKAAQGMIVGQIQGFIGADKARVIQSMIANSHAGASGTATAVGFIFLLWSASYVVSELQQSLNAIWGVDQAKLGWTATALRQLVSLAFILGMGFLMLVSLFLSTGAAAAGQIVGRAVGLPPFVLEAANALLTLGVITVMFALMLKFLPQITIAWKDVWAGAFFTALLFFVGNIVVGLYLGKAGPSSTYGAAGSFLTILLWVYYCAQLVYFGAEFTHVRAEAAAG